MMMPQGNQAQNLKNLLLQRKGAINLKNQSEESDKDEFGSSSDLLILTMLTNLVNFKGNSIENSLKTLNFMCGTYELVIVS